MGLSASKRVKSSLQNSPKFDSVCDSVYSECLDLSEHAFAGVRPYQLSGASLRLHQSLCDHHPLIKRWVPSPPTQLQVDRALRVVTRSGDSVQDQTLGRVEFKAFEVELFADAVVAGAGQALLRRVPIGVAGIAGVGLVARSGKELVATAIGVYALGVATSVYLGLSG
ncbi:hypothetical protein AAG906_009090 [Vitis piasezkii]|uniref:Uncharacterized protein n=2 Tax=Vitis vinifera TaxID=29760 RepID=A0A438DFV4_VITVI|nr:uncharacterized protein LOC100264616 [Vitis vinifera]XP_034685495.1 uncharacterized protein LOC117914319 [Vitis riparia]RVW34299.1 hypothetical protein CK203_097834 [Vitis vinifera]RVW88515.1 hypothetical protein CK203_033030 [Vitis vinifera]CAN65294.1 hypothetical protein VITISV_017781 [Vitis vinifera]|eukprot:XP_002274005.1 PREDICTED: uncharacterized protein LOC100264616 [Vitis vinifera]